MADTKISALTAATTPLAGTEQLPIVQGGETRRVSAAALGGSGPTHGYKNDRWYTGSEQDVVGTSIYLSSGVPIWMPFLLTSPATITKLACVVAAGASGNITLAIYSGSSGGPGTKLVETTAMSVVSSGEKIAVLGSPITLPAGSYWSGTLATTSSAQVYGYPANAGGHALYRMGHQYLLQSSGASNTPNGWQSVANYGSLPSTVSAANLTNPASTGQPAVYFQVS